jgi:hypothetical protein
MVTNLLTRLTGTHSQLTNFIQNIREKIMDRDSWLQDYDQYLDEQHQRQDQEEREQYEAELAVEKYKMEKNNGR